MDRRTFVTGAAALAGAGAAPATPAETTLLTSGEAPGALGTPIYFEVHGQPRGPNVFLANPVLASGVAPYTELILENKRGFIARLGDRYRLLIADYPYGAGRTGPAKSAEPMTVERVCQDYLALADAAGMKRFAAAGYSWGGNSVLQLATRSRRVTAVAVGGWPAIGGPYLEMLELSRKLAVTAALKASPFEAYYASLTAWPELKEVSRLTCPRLNYVDKSDDKPLMGIDVDMIGRFRRNRTELEKLGWRLMEVDSGDGHGGGLKPAVAGPLIRDFLDRATGYGGVAEALRSGPDRRSTDR